MKIREVRRRKAGDRGRRINLLQRAAVCALCLLTLLSLPVSAARAQDDTLRLVEAKRLELKEKETDLKREEERLNIIRKDVDDKIAAYTKLLARVEEALKKMDQVKGEKIESVVKAYEVMPPEDAAPRLSALDDATALLIMSRMKSKKAGAVIALMEPRKAAALTKSLTTFRIGEER